MKTTRTVKRRDSLGNVLAVEHWDYARKIMVHFDGIKTKTYRLTTDPKTWKTSLQEIRS